MKAEGALPLVAPSATALGVRVGNPGDENIDIVLSDDRRVFPKSGGMSVVPEWRSLPHFRIPHRLIDFCQKATGSNELYCWRWGDGGFNDDRVSKFLMLHVDSPRHGLVEPADIMSLVEYQNALGDTRSGWTIDEV